VRYGRLEVQPATIRAIDAAEQDRPDPLGYLIADAAADDHLGPPVGDRAHSTNVTPLGEALAKLGLHGREVRCDLALNHMCGSTVMLGIACAFRSVATRRAPVRPDTRINSRAG